MATSSAHEVSNRQPIVFQFEDIRTDIVKVRPGDTVSGFTGLDQVDSLVSPLAQLALFPSDESYRGGYYNRARPAELGPDGKPEFDGWRSGTMLPSAALQPKKVRGVQLFRGEYVNASVTLLSNSGPAPDYTQPVHAKILLDAELRTTGRGIVGRSTKLITVSEIPSPSGNRPSSRQVRYTALEGDTADLAVEFLLAESATNARLIAINGLSGVILAGLPTLGKRR